MSDRPGEMAETLVADGRPFGSALVGDEDTQEGAPLASGVVLAHRWELLGLLGVGGMGSVYRARDLELDEIVAVKVLRSELARSTSMLERFRREVKLARRVTHPNVARTFDIGEDGDLRFLTMELLDGRPLSSLMARDGRLSVERIASIGKRICAGLAAAHAADVIHRDLKPDNVLIERTGRVVITDFGIARALEIEGSASDTHGSVVGTPTYMAPEQMAHDAPIGPATDLYALGCMFFEMATGEPCWSGPTPLAVAAARLVSPPPNPSKLLPDLPADFVGLVMRLLAREAAARPSSAAEVGDLLALLAGGSASGSSPISLVPPGSLVPGAPSSIATPTTPSMTTSSVTSSPWAPPKTVAVLPIENRGDPADAYLAAGLTDDLVDLLTASPGLRVRSRAVAEGVALERADRGATTRDPREIGRALGVQVVVTGELRRQADTLQANVRVATVQDGFQLWAGRFRAPSAEFLRIGDEAAAAIAQALTAQPVEPRVAPTDARALDLYLRGRFVLRRSWGATPDAMPLLREAVERAPRDAVIRITYARALVRGVATGELPNDSAAVAWDIVNAALAESPDQADALLARAGLYLLRGETIEAIADLQASLAISPELEEGLALLGDIMADAGATARARATLERAVSLDPMHFTPRAALARIEALGGDASSAGVRLGDPPADRGDRDAYWISRARIALWNGDRADAELVRRSYVEVSEPSLLREVAASVVGATLGSLVIGGDTKLLELGMSGRAAPRIRAFRHQFRAEILCVLGEHERAVADVVAAEASGTFDFPWVERCPVLAPIRGLPGFEEAADRIRARASRVRVALGEPG